MAVYIASSAVGQGKFFIPLVFSLHNYNTSYCTVEVYISLLHALQSSRLVVAATLLGPVHMQPVATRFIPLSDEKISAKKDPEARVGVHAST